jgi:hypothetical protein
MPRTHSPAKKALMMAETQAQVGSGRSYTFTNILQLLFFIVVVDRTNRSSSLTSASSQIINNDTVRVVTMADRDYIILEEALKRVREMNYYISEQTLKIKTMEKKLQEAESKLTDFELLRKSHDKLEQAYCACRASKNKEIADLEEQLKGVTKTSKDEDIKIATTDDELACHNDAESDIDSTKEDEHTSGTESAKEDPPPTTKPSSKPQTLLSLEPLSLQEIRDPATVSSSTNTLSSSSSAASKSDDDESTNDEQVSHTNQAPSLPQLNSDLQNKD